MLARASLGKESSVKSAAKISSKPAHGDLQFSTESPRPEHEFTAPKFYWSIGNVVISAPSNGGTSRGDDGGPAHAASRFARLPWPMQAKLEVGAVDDPLEHEADRVAEHVMRIPDPKASTNSATSGPSPALRAGSSTASDSTVQRKCSCDGNCDKCRSEDREDKDGTLQRKRAVPDTSEPGASPTSSGMAAPPIVHEVLRSPGQPLDAATRAFFEPRFGYDLSQVRVHTSGTAAASAKAVQANAYTVGRHVVFGKGGFDPHTPTGQTLLAHELTHVVQQGTAARRFAFGLGASPVSIRGFSLPRIARDPPKEDQSKSKDPIHPEALAHLQEKLTRFYDRLTAKERWKLYRNSTIAFAYVTEEDDEAGAHPRLVYTVAGNRNSKEIEEAAAALGVHRLEPPQPRAKGRGAVGAPNDAEQLMVDGAEQYSYRVWGMAVNRRICNDCALHVKDADVPAVAVPDPEFRKGGRFYQYAQRPKSGDPGVGASSKAQPAKKLPVKKTEDKSPDAAKPEAKPDDIIYGKTARPQTATKSPSPSIGQDVAKPTASKKATSKSPAGDKPKVAGTPQPTKPRPSTSSTSGVPGQDTQPASGSKVVGTAASGANRAVNVTLQALRSQLNKMAHESCESKECAETIRSIDELESALNKWQDLQSLIKDPKKFATTFVATKVHDYLIDKALDGLTSAFDSEYATYLEKYPDISTVHAPLESGITLEEYERRYNQARDRLLAQLKEPGERQTLAHAFVFLGAPENMSEQDVEERKRVANQLAAAGSPEITESLQVYRDAQARYSYVLLLVAGSLRELSEKAANQPEHSALNIRRRGQALGLVAKGFSDTADNIMNAWLVAYFPGEIAYFDFKKVDAVVGGLASELDRFADVVEGRKAEYLRDLLRVENMDKKRIEDDKQIGISSTTGR